jgi:hypothetical protein
MKRDATRRSEETAGLTTFPVGIHPSLDGSSWEYWLAPTGPQPEDKAKDAYAKWMQRSEVATAGVYLWLWPIGEGLYRLYYSGKSARMGARTIEHCACAYESYQVRTIPSAGYGPLGENLRAGRGRAGLTPLAKAIIDDQLSHTRILFLRPVSTVDVPEVIHQLEGVVDHVARKLLGSENTTNTAPTAHHDLDDEQAGAVVDWLNGLVPMLPSEPGRSRSCGL